MEDIVARLKEGLSAAENADLYYSQERELEVKAFRGEIASVQESDNVWVAGRVCHQNRLGTAFAERIDPDAISIVVARARENAPFADEDPGNTLFNEAQTGDFDGRKGDLASLSVDRKKDKALAAEAAARAHDTRITNVQHCYYFETDASFAIVNTHGLRKTQRATYCGCLINVTAKDGEETQTASQFRLASDPSLLQMDDVAITAATHALAKLGAREMDSGEYAIAFDHEAASQLLGAVIASQTSPFFGENIQKGRSMLAGRQGQKIGSELFTIVDDPHRGLNPVFFDGDGVETACLPLVDQGVFTNVVHSVYSAAREPGTKTTGHASRTRLGVGTGLHHPFLVNGTGALDDLLTAMQSGILVTEVEGLHAGLNQVTGDFSLSAKGFFIEDGARAYPVRNIVVAGNFFELASRLVAAADDLPEDSRSGFDAPSIWIEKLSVSGK